MECVNFSFGVPQVKRICDDGQTDFEGQVNGNKRIPPLIPNSADNLTIFLLSGNNLQF